MKLRTKIHTYTTALMLLMLICTDLAVYYVYEKMTYDSEASHVIKRGEDLITLLQGTDNRDEATEMLRAYVPSDGVVSIVQPGKKSLTVQTTSDLEDFKPTFEKGATYAIHLADDTPFMSTSKPFIWENGEIAELQMSQSLEETERNLYMLRLVLTIVTVLAMLPILLSNMALARVITQPIERLIQTMRRNKQTGEFETLPITSKGRDELYEMGYTFNGMIAQIEENYRKQEQFLSNASHELRTPLTIIESYASLLKRRGTANEEITQEAIEAIAGESKRMKAMMEQMLALAKNNEQSIVFEDVDIKKMLEEMADRLTQVYGARYSVSADEASCITDETKLKQLVFIFLDNARRYSEGMIELTATREPTHVHIQVRDYGEGIPEDKLKQVFERFYRVSEDRNRKSGGTGLGLAIAKDLATRLHVKLEIESTVGQGTTLHCYVPYE